MEEAVSLRAALGALLGVHQPGGEPVKCGLPLALQARAVRSSAPPEQRVLIERLLSREERQKKRSSGFFAVHYDTAGTNAAALLDARLQRIPGSADAFADSVLAIATAVYMLEVGTLHYESPPADGQAGGGPEYDIYVRNLGSEYGETMPETPLDNAGDGGRFLTYMSIHNDFSFVNPDSLKGMPALRVTLAHEFFHAIQLGQYGYWTSQTYFYELSSTWMETVAYPEVPDYLHYLSASWGHFRNPSTPFTSNETIMYSRSIWGTFLASRFSTDIMREIWIAIRVQPPLQANDAVLRRKGSSLKIEFAEWTLWNYMTQRRARPEQYYPAGAFYPAVTSTGITVAASGQRAVDGTLPPLAARYYDVTPGVDTTCLIVANLNDASALSSPPPQFAYSVIVGGTKPDESFEQGGSGVYYKPVFPDVGNWKIWATSGGTGPLASGKRGVPFPNPLLVDGQATVFLPAPGPSGHLRVYDSAMQLVYASSQQVELHPFGQSGYKWNGRTSANDLASSGVYFYTIETPGGTVTGKLALLRAGQ